MTTTKLRMPSSSESEDCAKLVYISGPHLYSYSLSLNKPKIYDFFKLFYSKPDTLYSKEQIVVADENGSIKALVLAYPANEMRKLANNMSKNILGIIRISGFLNFLKMLLRLKLNRYFPGLENEELFISNLAVFEESRGKGIAVKLLQHLEELAIKKDLAKLSLYVEVENLSAKKIYEKFGFQEEKKIDLPKTYNRHNLFGFYKMIKKLKP